MTKKTPTPTLKDLSYEFLDKEAVDKLLPEIDDITQMLTEDREVDPSARQILDIIETGKVTSLDDFMEVSGLIQGYRDNAIIGRALSYKFEEPMNIEELFGDPRQTSGRLVVVRKGQRVEVNETMEAIGPVDEADNPLPGHPEYDGPDSDRPVPYEADPEVRVGQYIPYVQRRRIEQDKEMDRYIERKRRELEEREQRRLDRVSNSSSNVSALTHPEIRESHLEGGDSLSMPPDILKDLESVLFHLRELGTLQYEPEEVIKTKHSLNLVFNPRRSRPAFIPAPGQTFELEWRNETFYVMYVGNRFEYSGALFLCFGLIPRLPESSRQDTSEFEDTPAPESSLASFEEALEHMSGLTEE